MRGFKLRTAIHTCADKLGLNAAVSFSVAARMWQLFGATFTVLLMSVFFSPQEQGYYYTIVSLLAAQNLLDLGFAGILVLLTSHEWSESELVDGEISGPEHSTHRIAYIFRFGRLWYLGCAILFALVVIPIGMLVMTKTASTPTATNISWTLPWILSVLINSISMCFSPHIAIIEGCNQVVAANRMRFWQSISGSVCVWFYPG